MSALSRRLHAATVPVGATLVVGLLGTGCQGGEDSGSSVDRGVVDRGFQEIMVEAVGDGQPTNGAAVEGCPVLAPGSLDQIAEDSDVELGAEDDARGFAVVLGSYYSVSCDVGDLTLTVSQTRALDAEEYVDALPADPPDGALRPSAGATAADLDEDHVFVDEERATAGWVDDGLVVTASFSEESDGTVDDAGAVLVPARDAVLEVLQESSTSGDGYAGPPDGGLDRADVVEALQQALPEDLDDGAALQPLSEEACPVLGEDDGEQLSDELGLDLTPVAGDVARASPDPFVSCRLGPDGTVLTVSLERPRSVEEFAFRTDSPLLEAPDRDVQDVSEGLTGLDAERTMLVVEGEQQQVGWIDNGLTILVTVPDGVDPGALISATVPAVLERVGLD